MEFYPSEKYIKFIKEDVHLIGIYISLYIFIRKYPGNLLDEAPFMTWMRSSVRINNIHINPYFIIDLYDFSHNECNELILSINIGTSSHIYSSFFYQVICLSFDTQTKLGKGSCETVLCRNLHFISQLIYHRWFYRNVQWWLRNFIHWNISFHHVNIQNTFIFSIYMFCHMQTI